MQARVKKSYKFNKIRACAGAEFVKDEYRPVPEDREAEAQANPYLELKGSGSKPAAEKKLTSKELKAMAKEAGVEGYSKMKVDELRDVLGV